MTGPGPTPLPGPQSGPDGGAHAGELRDRPQPSGPGAFFADPQPITRTPGAWSDDQRHKADAGKRRWDLMLWRELGQVVDVLTYGAAKYGERTWQQVEPRRYEAALLRHYSAWAQGEQRDAESGLPHLAHVAVNALFLLYLWPAEARRSGGE